MTTDKKNQHYVPKFYLRNFSCNSNKKQIGVYNINNQLFVPKAKLKTQGSRNFFYGQDGVIEDDLSNIEGNFATIIREIIQTRNLPLKNSGQHFNLLFFAILTDLRNPSRIDGMQTNLAEMRRRLLELDPGADAEKIVPVVSHDDMVKISLSHAVEMSTLILDLEYKILINNTSTPFITSDFPVVKYNQFLESKNWPHSKSGIGSVGLQIFIPLCAELMLVFFDKDIYKLGDKKKQHQIITDVKNIDELNILQFLNCIETVFFNEKATEAYIRSIEVQSKKYRRANQTRSEVGYLIKENDDTNRRIVESGFKNFLQVKKTDCEINLKIDGLKIHSKGKKHELTDRMLQLRPYVQRVRKSKTYRL